VGEEGVIQAAKATVGTGLAHNREPGFVKAEASSNRYMCEPFSAAT